MLVPPQVSAHSFLAAKGVPGGAWSLGALLEVRQALRQLEPRDRAALPELLRKALASGWDGVLSAQEDGIKSALSARKAALEDAAR